MAVTTFTIDGKPVSARPGDRILDVAREAGIPIPTLCQMDGLSRPAACRLCLVEAAGSHRLLASCVTAPTEGMEVQTDTPRLRAYRRLIVEMLLRREARRELPVSGLSLGASIRRLTSAHLRGPLPWIPLPSPLTT